MATTYRLVLVGPSLAASTANGTPVEWVLDHDEAVVTLGEESQEINTENDNITETPAERARRLLEELEKEGSDLEGKEICRTYFQRRFSLPLIVDFNFCKWKQDIFEEYELPNL
jgi:hypothetical protein